MSIIVNSNPNPNYFMYNNQACSKVYWNNNLVWPAPEIAYFWIMPDQNDALVYDYNTTGQTVPEVSKTIKYSFDANTWIQYTSPVQIMAGQKIYLLSETTDSFCVLSGGTYGAVGAKGLSMANRSTFSAGGSIKALFNNILTMPMYGMSRFFWGSTIRDASSIIFTLTSEFCYHLMFSDCRYLTSVPALPMTELSHGCYAYMFWNSQNLTSLPALPATTLAYGCYTSMFYECYSLRFSETQTSMCPNAFRLPSSGTVSIYNKSDYYYDMFGGAAAYNPFVSGMPEPNTTYYTNATIIS